MIIDVFPNLYVIKFLHVPLLFSTGQFSDDYTAMSAILQTACTSSNGRSGNNSRSETPSGRDNSARDINNGTNQETATGNSLNPHLSSAPDLDGMTTHAASSVADTSEFPLDFSEDPANQLFAADSDPEEDSEQEASEILHHQSPLLSRSTVRERNVGMSPLFVDTSSATSSPTRSIRPRSPNPSHEVHSSARHIPSHLSTDRGAPILGQNERYGTNCKHISLLSFIKRNMKL